MMSNETLVALMKTEAQKLIGNLASYQKFADKFEFNAKIRINIDILHEICDDLTYHEPKELPKVML